MNDFTKDELECLFTALWTIERYNQLTESSSLLLKLKSMIDSYCDDVQTHFVAKITDLLDTKIWSQPRIIAGFIGIMDFTEKELRHIDKMIDLVKLAYPSYLVDKEIQQKIQSMIENYCDHKGAIPGIKQYTTFQCNKCGKGNV